MSEFATVDYVLVASSLAMALFGAFGGFSGALAFLLGSVAGGAVAKFGWDFACGAIENVPVRVLAVGAAAIIAFGIARAIVRKVVSGMLAQPGDAIFGFVVGAATGLALAGAVMTLAGPDYFALFQEKGCLLSLVDFGGARP
ncbi:MAG: hypothetical protein II909_01730 [Kiritimatiellae bacterium]|nr:hypothetical protein [Kiritimatiellia bacterium]